MVEIIDKRGQLKGARVPQIVVVERYRAGV